MSMVENCEILSLSIQDLNRMKAEFHDCYEKLFDDAFVRLRRTWLAKLKAMKECRRQLREFNRNEKLKAQLQGLNTPYYIDEDDMKDRKKFI